jgi:hypothetical protein
MSEAAEQFRTMGAMDDECLSEIRDDVKKRQGRKAK